MLDLRMSIARLAASLIAALSVLHAGTALAAPVPAGSTAILSGAPSLFDALPIPAADSTGSTSSVSSDGRFVAFESESDGLVADDDEFVRNIYVKDRVTGSVTLVSRASGPNGEPSHDGCDEPTISDNGQVVAFTCVGSLDPTNDKNGVSDVYARNVQAATTTLVSRGDQLGPAGNATSSAPVLSADGTEVAFHSTASNLTGAALNKDLRVYRRTVGATDGVVLVSRKSGATGAIVTGGRPSISDDGTKIAFSSGEKVDATDTNNATDVYVRDVAGGTTVLASRKSGDGEVGNGPSYSPAIAGNGSAVAFESYANQFDFGQDPDTEADIYRRSLVGPVNLQNTALVSINAAGDKGYRSTDPSIDASGDVIGFLSRGASLDPADTGEAIDAYVKDTGPSNALHLVSRADGDDGEAANDGAGAVAVSGDGKKAAVSLGSGRVVPGVDPVQPAVILRDFGASPRRTEAVSRPEGGAPFVNQGGESRQAALSADGRFAAFITSAPALLPAGVYQGVVVRDRVTGSVTLASRADGADGAPFADVYEPAISADGRRVAFGAGNGQFNDIWVRDLADGRTFRASRGDGEAGPPANSASGDPALDADGSRVVFVSHATNLGDGDTTGDADVHLRDLATNQTILVSRANGPGGAKGDDSSLEPAVDASGTRVAFMSTAKNLGDGDSDDKQDIHLRDLTAETTTLVSSTPDGVKGDDASTLPSIDASGSRIAFETRSKNLPGTNGEAQVLVRDLAAGTLVLASRADGPDGAPGNVGSLASSISPDGGYVAFTSGAGNLTADSAAGRYGTYRRSLAAGRTELVSRRNGADGAPLTRTARAAGISAGGSCVAFETDDAVFGPASSYQQVYLRALRDDCAFDGPAGDPNGGGAGPDTAGRDATAPVISRVRLTRRQFRVGRAATARSAAARRGTVLRFRSSEAGRLRIRVQRIRRTRAGLRFRRAGTLTRRIRAGAGRVRLSGRIGRKAMRPGRYRLTLVASDVAGNRSVAVRRKLVVLRG